MRGRIERKKRLGPTNEKIETLTEVQVQVGDISKGRRFALPSRGKQISITNQPPPPGDPQKCFRGVVVRDTLANSGQQEAVPVV